MRNVLGTMVVCALVPLTTGCGTFINGMHQDLTVTSSPGGADVSVDGVPLGTTPVVTSVSRKHAHVVKVEQPGYHPVESSVVPETSSWEWGNVIFGGFIGVAVDAWTGGMYYLSQDRINAIFPRHQNNPVKSAAEAPPTPTAYQ